MRFNRCIIVLTTVKGFKGKYLSLHAEFVKIAINSAEAYIWDNLPSPFINNRGGGMKLG